MPTLGETSNYFDACITPHFLQQIVQFCYFLTFQTLIGICLCL